MAVLSQRSGRVSTWIGRALRPLLALLCVIGLQAGTPTTVISSEFQLKAVFLFNFAQFVEWPPQAFANAESPVVIALVGHDPFGRYLDELVRDEHVGRRSIVIRRCARAEEIGECHILFVGSSEAGHLESVLAGLKARHVLTVSDCEGFNRAGGMVRLVVAAGKILLRINLEAARAAKLLISSKILRPATIVAPGRD